MGRHSRSPEAEGTRPGIWVPLAPCDATASGAEDGQVRLAMGGHELALCGHHADMHEFALAVSGWRVTHDNRDCP
jgi:hypothetical protein